MRIEIAKREADLEVGAKRIRTKQKREADLEATTIYKRRRVTMYSSKYPLDLLQSPSSMGAHWLGYRVNTGQHPFSAFKAR
jgi:hypothetical protein